MLGSIDHAKFGELGNCDVGEFILAWKMYGAQTMPILGNWELINALQYQTLSTICGMEFPIGQDFLLDIQNYYWQCISTAFNVWFNLEFIKRIHIISLVFQLPCILDNWNIRGILKNLPLIPQDCRNRTIGMGIFQIPHGCGIVNFRAIQRPC